MPYNDPESVTEIQRAKLRDALKAQLIVTWVWGFVLGAAVSTIVHRYLGMSGGN